MRRIDDAGVGLARAEVACDALDADAELKAMLGNEFSTSYMKMKQQEWNSFVSHFTDWEREHTLDI